MDAELGTARELATHAAEIKHLQADMDRLVNDMDEIKQTLTSIKGTLSEATGGWRMLMLLGGAAGVAGAAVMQIVHWITGR